MKILFVEDTDMFVERFKPQLEELGEVVHFKSSNAARRWMSGNSYDLIVCDHYILRLEDSGFATGLEVYNHDRMYNNTDIPFIHFSSEPCPEQYALKGDDALFWSLEKSYSADLMTLVKKAIGTLEGLL